MYILMIYWYLVRTPWFFQGLNTLFPLKGAGSTEFYIRGNIEVCKDDTVNFYHIKRTRTYIKNVYYKVETIFETNIRKYGPTLLDRYHTEIYIPQLLIGDDISK